METAKVALDVICTSIHVECASIKIKYILLRNEPANLCEFNSRELEAISRDAVVWLEDPSWKVDRWNNF